jgi:hypothetical protein
MRRFAAVAGSLLLTAGLVLALAGPASAGDPSTAVVVNTGSGEATAVYGTSPSYAALAIAIGETEHHLARPPRLDALGGSRGRWLTVTWLMRDGVWRVDHLYLDASGGPLVNRMVGNPAGPESPAQTYWQRTRSPDTLTSLMRELHVDGKVAHQGQPTPQFPATLTAPTPDAAAPAPTPRAASGRDTTPGWWWALPGAAGGALAVWGAMRVRATAWRPRTEDDGPRQELIDSEPF